MTGNQLLPAESEQLSSEVHRAFGRLADLVGIGPAGVTRLQRAQEKITEPHDDHHHVVEVVSHSSGEAAHGFHLLSLADLFFGPPAFREVLNIHRIVRHLSRFVSDGGGIDQGRENSPVPVQPLGLPNLVPAGIVERVHPGKVGRPSRQLTHRFAAQLLDRPAVHRGERRVDALDGPSICNENRNAPTGVLEDPGPPLQLFADFHALTDVTPHPDDTRDFTIRTMYRGERGLHVTQTALRAEGPFICDSLACDRTLVCRLVQGRVFSENFSGSASNEMAGIDALSLQPAAKDVDTTLVRVQSKDDVVDRLEQLAETLLTHEQWLAFDAAGLFPGKTD